MNGMLLQTNVLVALKRQLFPVRNLPMKDTNMIAIGFEGAYLRQSDYVVDLSGDEGMYGYYGVRKLMEMIDKSVDEKADLKKMIDEYGAVV